jgi:RNA 2',3'-cyclic 3'-phosphodiesterase
MTSVRCFIAIDFNQATIAKICELQKWMDTPPIHGLRWIRKENLHLTLKFIGETEMKMIPEIKSILDEIASGSPAVEINLSKLGVFPNWRNPRILWVGIENPDDLILLASRIDMGLIKKGFTSEDRPFNPHLTIARIKDDFSVLDIGKLKNKCDHKFPSFAHERIIEIKLYKSDLLPDGAVYSLLHLSHLKQ